ncbi:MAG: hypothetical protein JXC32_21365 [Anaerolineae bacterium]|nr:hypothetical protein [Anaerolineae bacterium]
MPPGDFFVGCPTARELFESMCDIIDTLGEHDIRVTKTQIAFRRHRSFAWVWMPGRHLRGEVAPLVLTVGLHRREPSPRWKEIVEPYPGRFTHHLEIYAVDDIDGEVRDRLRETWELAA